MTLSNSYAAQARNALLAPFTLNRRDMGPKDVDIDILYCGVCHSDVHQVQDEWGNTVYPCVPGHEIVGRVARIGAAVRKFQVGDLAAVGCLVNSCRECPSCYEGLEQYCERGNVATYNGREKETGAPTFGGYSNRIVVDEAFTLRVPGNLAPAGVAPLLCAGITVYSPLRHWRAGPGKTVGVVGLGGLGHLAVKIARAMGAQVVLFTTSAEKAEDGRRLGAHEVVLSTDATLMAQRANSVDLVLDTVSVRHDVNVYLALLKRDATLIQLGAANAPLAVGVFYLIGRRGSIAGSLIGGLSETQEMLDFCGQHGIIADVELIAIQEINNAYERLLASDVKYRFVIDIASLPRLAS